MRRELWGYAPDEQLTQAELIAERYPGIRPAPGYGCQPDHTEKQTIFALLAAPEGAGIQLTESYAMTPGSSVSGLYIAHPESRYFGVGRIGTDQVEDYAARKGWTVDEARRWLITLIDDEAPVAATAVAPELNRAETRLACCERSLTYPSYGVVLLV